MKMQKIKKIIAYAFVSAAEWAVAFAVARKLANAFEEMQDDIARLYRQVADLEHRKADKPRRRPTLPEDAGGGLISVD